MSDETRMRALTAAILEHEGGRVRLTAANGRQASGTVGRWDGAGNGEPVARIDGKLACGEILSTVRIEAMGANGRYSSVWDWRHEIAEAARETLTENGCCLVALPAGSPPVVVSRLYKRADYPRTGGYVNRGALEIACRQQSRAINADGERCYVVQRHDDGLTVYLGLNHVLVSVP